MLAKIGHGVEHGRWALFLGCSGDFGALKTGLCLIFHDFPGFFGVFQVLSRYFQVVSGFFQVQIVIFRVFPGFSGVFRVWAVETSLVCVV